eukprot:282884-Prorocentrum_minimum.AAC.1
MLLSVVLSVGVLSADVAVLIEGGAISREKYLSIMRQNIIDQSNHPSKHHRSCLTCSQGSSDQKWKSNSRRPSWSRAALP